MRELSNNRGKESVNMAPIEINKIEKWLHDFLNYFIKEAVNDTVGREYNVSIYDDDTGMNVLLAEVYYQFFYNPLTNKAFIEFTFNHEFMEQFDNIASVATTIIRYVKDNIRNDKNIRVWPEILMLEDGVSEKCDSSPILTPFTIGYWKSLSGNYSFITDKVEIAEVWKELIPEFPDGFEDDLDVIYNQYYISDFNRFSDELYKLLVQYNVKYDAGPTKNIRDFFDQVIAINKAYRNPKLDESDWVIYNQRYAQLVKQYKDPDEFKIHLDALNEEYGITLGLNSKVPEMFELYKVKFAEFFNTAHFPKTKGHVFRYGIKVCKID